MSYSQVRCGTVTNNVGLALSVDHLVSPSAGAYGKHLRTGVIYSLDQTSKGSYSTAIGDVVVTLKESNGISSGQTRFEVKDADIVEAGAGKKLGSLLPQWATTLVQGTITYAAARVDPMFGVLTNALFQHCGGSTHIGDHDTVEITLRDSAKWSFIKQRTKPGSYTFNFDIALLLAPNTSNTSVSGTVTYEVTVEAITFDRAHLPFVIPRMSPTGRISEQTTFSIDWQ